MTIPVSILWNQDQLTILNQQKLPHVIEYIHLDTIEAVFDAIISLKVRGAPAIGITAAYGLAIGASQFSAEKLEDFQQELHEQYIYLAGSRPTAVNLFWALERLMKKAETAKTMEEAKAILLAEAIAIHKEDEEHCRKIGEYALSVLGDYRNVMTICNAGSIATAKYGTALAPFHLGAEIGKEFHVYACETRPVFQGSRLTVWELQQSGVEVTLITDGMAAHTIQAKGVQAIIAGADRIAANGDSANKIGTLGLAILAKAFKIPFFIAAPSSTFDLNLADGTQIPIEERDEKEITHIGESRIAPEGTLVYNPAFDVTPNEYITGIITEKGIIYPDYQKNIHNTLGEQIGEEVSQ
ncbi:MAG: S-methyl-5-thioribose-1-phosphate isomerase [Cytobacillus gottheilii]|uniref:S-methyl-5-thioribose-1-phosphate isomerase n=1 Tax=Cytobacillus gottheilii TaxID=859144 RepID=UPI003463DD15